MAANKKTGWWILASIVLITCILLAGWHFLKKDLANPRSKIVKPLLTGMSSAMMGFDQHKDKPDENVVVKVIKKVVKPLQKKKQLKKDLH